MIKKIIVSIVMLSVILFCVTNVNAANGSANLIASSTSVKPGDTFTVTLSVNCEDGINGIDTTYSYDEDKLELVNANVGGNNWASLGVNGTIQVICNSTSKITSDNVYVLTFKVKDNAEVGTTAKINTTEIKVDSDANESNFTEGAKTVNINIISESDNNNNGNEDFNIHNNNESQSSDTTINNNGGTPTNNENQDSSTTTNNNNQLINTSGSKNTSQKSDNSTSNKALPKTGKSNKILVISIILISILSIGLYIKIRK